MGNGPEKKLHRKSPMSFHGAHGTNVQPGEHVRTHSQSTVTAALNCVCHTSEKSRGAKRGREWLEHT